MPDKANAPREIPSQDWGDSEVGLSISATRPDDGGIVVAVDHEHADTVAWSASAQQAREVAAALVQRADLIDPPSRRKVADVPSTPSEIISEFLRTTQELSRSGVDPAHSPAEHMHRILHLCDQFAVVALMAALENTDPDVAARIAEMLADAWEDGGSIHEFLYEWREAHAAGRPIGFNPPAILHLDVRRIE